MVIEETCKQGVSDRIPQLDSSTGNEDSGSDHATMVVREVRRDLKIHPFSGTHWAGFVKQFEKFAQLSGWSQRDKSEHFFCYLKGPAWEFYSKLPDEVTDNYAALVKAFNTAL